MHCGRWCDACHMRKGLGSIGIRKVMGSNPCWESNRDFGWESNRIISWESNSPSVTVWIPTDSTVLQKRKVLFNFKCPSPKTKFKCHFSSAVSDEHFSSSRLDRNVDGETTDYTDKADIWNIWTCTHVNSKSFIFCCHLCEWNRLIRTLVIIRLNRISNGTLHNLSIKSRVLLRHYPLSSLPQSYQCLS